jgi:hypothetical protein
MCLEMMDFDDKDAIMQKIANMGTMQQKLLQYMQLALSLAQRTDPMLANQIANDVMMTSGGAAMPMGMGGTPSIAQADNIGGMPKKEHALVSKARQQSNEASQPGSDGMVADRGMAK